MAAAVTRARLSRPPRSQRRRGPEDGRDSGFWSTGNRRSPPTTRDISQGSAISQRRVTVLPTQHQRSERPPASVLQRRTLIGVTHAAAVRCCKTRQGGYDPTNALSSFQLPPSPVPTLRLTYLPLEHSPPPLRPVNAAVIPSARSVTVPLARGRDPEPTP